jgi:hypothetical protein
MAHAYTPGLRVTERTEICRERRLPVKGSVLVSEDQTVEADTEVAKAELPGPVHSLNAANQMGIDAADLEEVLSVRLGDRVRKGDVLARGGGLFGLFRQEVKAPVDGVLESASNVTGQVLLRGEAIPITVEAYVQGRVERVLPEEGVVVRTEAALIQGIFGIGGERRGDLQILSASPDRPLEASDLSEDVRGAVVVGGSLATMGSIRAAIRLGAAAVVAGGLRYSDLTELLGHPIGVAVTGEEQIGVTVIVTEGFGEIPMARRTWELLSAHAGRKASVNGATQIRAGVIRPEIVIPGDSVGEGAAAVESGGSAVEVGSTVRVIREPWFGHLAQVEELPPELEALETEARVRVARVRLAEGSSVVVPRANIELIEH